MRLKSPTVGPILGYTTATDCRILFRGQFDSTGESTYRRCFGLLKIRAKGAKKWSEPLFNKMSPNFDMTCVLCPMNLKADTIYEYQVGWIYLDTGLDKISSLSGALIEWPKEIYSFKSATDNSKSDRSYIVGSCRYLLKTFIGEVFDDRGDKTFKSILSQHEKTAIHGVLMIGDQIYADDLNFAAPDTKLPEFLRRYRTVFSQEHIRNLMANVPTYMILDDHEVEDNWPSKSSESDKITLYPNAIHAYQIYQCSHSPLFKADSDGRIDGTLQKFWYTFSDGCADWFVMDSRTERVLSKNQRRMVKEDQLNALLEWLKEGDSRVKMVVTSVPFAPDMDSDSGDKWGAFPEQRTKILDCLGGMTSAKVVFVSGDVHCSFTAEIRKQPDTKPLAYQIVSSSFFWPYPHMSKGDFIQNKPLLTLPSTNTYVASITSPVYSEDNFARLDISKNQVKVSFFQRKGDFLGMKDLVF